MTDFDFAPSDIRAAVETRVAAEAAAFGTGTAGGQSPRTFRFLGLTELFSQPAPPRWLIRGILEQGTLASLFGAPGSMKTFAALDMSLSVASGLPWHGQAVPGPGPVFYVCGEGFSGLSRRVRAWTRAHGVAETTPFFVSSEPVLFLDPLSLETAMTAVAELAARHGPPRLAVVDTLNRNFGPGDENSTADMTAFVAALDRLKTRFDCAVLVVHHTGLQDQNRARGASAFRAALDFEYRLDVSGDARTLSCSKCKDHESPADIAFEPETVGTGLVDEEDGREITSCVLRRTETPTTGKKGQALKGASKIAHDALAALCADSTDGAQGVHVDAWRVEAYRRGISPSSEQGAKQRAFHRAFSGLIDSGQVEADGDYYRLSLPSQTRQTDQTKPRHVFDLSAQTDKTHSYRSVLLSGSSGSGEASEGRAR